MSAIVQTRGLTREFAVRGRGLSRGRMTAVDGLTITIGAGESVGYIGANGAGKSTTIKMLTGILVPTRGEVRTCGLDPLKQRRNLARRVGVVFGQRSQLWWDLPVAESFRILAAIHGLGPEQEGHRTDELIERLEMGGYLRTPVRQLSLGQRMRAEVAAALLHSPELVILDEPTIGLDVLSSSGCASSSSPSGVRTAPRCCSPPTTWATSSDCATGCWSWTTDGWRMTERWVACPRL